MTPQELKDFLHRNKMTGNELAAKDGATRGKTMNIKLKPFYLKTQPRETRAFSSQQ